MRGRLAIVLFALLTVAGCGEKNLIDDSLSSEAQARSLVDRFQDAVEAGDDEAACELMTDEMRRNIEGSAVLVDGELQEVSCGVDAALRNPESARSSLPEARVVYVAIDRHDDGADVQLDNGTRLRLERGGESADGEWRINSAGFRPSPADWRSEVNPLSPSDPRAAARRVSDCLNDAGFDAKVLVTGPADTDAPDAAVAFQRGTARADGGEVAIYGPGVEAVDKLEALEKEIQGFDGASDPRGRAGIVFFGQPSDQTRDAVRLCVR